MTGKEKLEKALNFEEFDSIPFDIGATTVSSITKTAFENAMSAKGMPFDIEDMDAFDPIQQIVQPVPAIHRELGIDTYRIGPPRLAGPEAIHPKRKNRHFYLKDQFGCNWEFESGKDYYYNLTSSPLEKFDTAEEGLKEYTFPTLKNSRNELIPILSLQTEKIKELGVVADRNCAGITEVAFRIRGYEKFFMDLALDPKGASILMEKILQYKLDYWSFFAEFAKEKCIDHDILVAAECDDLGTQDSLLFSPDMIKRLIMPLQAQLIRHIKSLFPNVKMMYHSDGAIFELIPKLIDIGIDILNPVQFTAAGMDLKRLKTEFGKELVFWGGGVDTQATLPHGTPEQVRDEVKRNIDILAPGGGFVFAAVHNIQADVPAENFWAMWETLRNY